jgi:hypothetical protein
MKLTIGILAMGLAVGTAWGQNTDAIENTRDTMKALQQKQVMDQNAALGSSQAQPSNPAPSAPKSASSSQPAGKPKVTSAAKPATPKAEQATITIVRTPKVSPTVKIAAAPKVVAKSAVAKSAVAKSVAAKRTAPKTVAAKTQVKAASKAPKAEQVVAVEDKKNAAEPKKQEEKKINLTGRRDPFVSPIVNRSMLGSGCSTGKRCLAIDQIALKGVVRSDTGMIAVVTNALDKAYFLHENDPVFNGYVVKITGDSIVFKETVQDKLGKPFMREVTKTITTPAV